MQFSAVAEGLLRRQRQVETLSAVAAVAVPSSFEWIPRERHRERQGEDMNEKHSSHHAFDPPKPRGQKSAVRAV